MDHARISSIDHRSALMEWARRAPQAYPGAWTARRLSEIAGNEPRVVLLPLVHGVSSQGGGVSLGRKGCDALAVSRILGGALKRMDDVPGLRDLVHELVTTKDDMGMYRRLGSLESVYAISDTRITMAFATQPGFGLSPDGKTSAFVKSILAYPDAQWHVGQVSPRYNTQAWGNVLKRVAATHRDIAARIVELGMAGTNNKACWEEAGILAGLVKPADADPCMTMANELSACTDYVPASTETPDRIRKMCARAERDADFAMRVACSPWGKPSETVDDPSQIMQNAILDISCRALHKHVRSRDILDAHVQMVSHVAAAHPESLCKAAFQMIWTQRLAMASQPPEEAERVAQALAGIDRAVDIMAHVVPFRSGGYGGREQSWDPSFGYIVHAMGKRKLTTTETVRIGFLVGGELGTCADPSFIDAAIQDPSVFGNNTDRLAAISVIMPDPGARAIAHLLHDDHYDGSLYPDQLRQALIRDASKHASFHHLQAWAVRRMMDEDRVRRVVPTAILGFTDKD